MIAAHLETWWHQELRCATCGITEDDPYCIELHTSVVGGTDMATKVVSYCLDCEAIGLDQQDRVEVP